MMSNKSPKNNHPKLKWWQKGALVGLGWAIITTFFVLVGAEAPEPAGMVGMFFVELPILPIFHLFLLLFGWPSFHGTSPFLLAHFAGWILGGIFYAWIFRWIVKLFHWNKFGAT